VTLITQSLSGKTKIQPGSIWLQIYVLNLNHPQLPLVRLTLNSTAPCEAAHGEELIPRWWGWDGLFQIGLREAVVTLLHTRLCDLGADIHSPWQSSVPTSVKMAHRCPWEGQAGLGDEKPCDLWELQFGCRAFTPHQSYIKPPHALSYLLLLVCMS
jgi:hypothetical protein